VGAQLVRAVEGEARRLGFGTLYAATANAASLLRRLGWTEVERLDHGGASLGIFRRDLAAAA
jgi:N-acetylglutamate synthase-like GNAT family acetyltransferase